MSEVIALTAMSRRVRSDRAGDVDVLAAVIGALEPHRARLDALYGVPPGEQRVAAHRRAETIIRRCLAALPMPVTVSAAATEVTALWRCSDAASGAGPAELLADACSLRARAIEDRVLTATPAQTIADVLARLRWMLSEAEEQVLEPEMAAGMLRVTLDDLARLAGASAPAGTLKLAAGCEASP